MKESLKRPQQLALDLESGPSYVPEEFIVAEANQQAYQWIMKWPDWPTPGLILYGDEGCGKTHLAHIWRQRSRALFLQGKDIQDLTWLQENPVHVIFRLGQGETADPLFHLYNLAAELKISYLILSVLPPVNWLLSLKDAESRIRSLPAVYVGSPDDALLEQVLLKRFSDLQLQVPEAVIRYLVTHMPRHFRALQEIVRIIDRLSLSSHRKITLPMVKEAILSVSGFVS